MLSSVILLLSWDYIYKYFPFLKDVALLGLVDSEWRRQAVEEFHTLKDNVTHSVT